ncbi:MAG: hypothetical protein ACTFAK_08325 [Candidatus Electronema sp. VV]
MLSAAGQAGCRIGGETFLWVRAEESAMRQAQKTMAAPKRTTKAESEEGIARFLAALDAHTKLLAFFFGLCFVAALLVLAVWFPQPTPFQYTVFRIVLALAAAGVAGVIPGMIRLKAQPGTALLIHAGGALAVFVMVYLLAPAALPQEQPASPLQPKKEEMPAAQPLKISGVDAIENGVHILDFTPPLTRHTVRLSNIGETPVHISLIGFPGKYFYTNLADEKSLFQGHEDRDMSVILMLNVPEQKEYVFEVSDSAGGTARVAVRIKEGWKEYIAQQIQKIDDKIEQGASALELYHTAKRVIASSGYKELAAPLQEVFTAQLLEAAKQPEAAAMAYAKAKKEAPKITKRFTDNKLFFVKSDLAGADKKIEKSIEEKNEYAQVPIYRDDRPAPTDTIKETSVYYVGGVWIIDNKEMLQDYSNSLYFHIANINLLCENCNEYDSFRAKIFLENAIKNFAKKMSLSEYIFLYIKSCNCNNYSETFKAEIDIFFSSYLSPANNIIGNLSSSFKNESCYSELEITYASENIEKIINNYLNK